MCRSLAVVDTKEREKVRSLGRSHRSGKNTRLRYSHQDQMFRRQGNKSQDNRLIPVFKRHHFVDGECTRCGVQQLPHVRKAING